MRVFFALVIVFLYAPIAILLVFSFNNADVPVVPAQRLHAALVPRLPPQRRPAGGARDERDRRDHHEHHRRRARYPRLDRASRGAASAAEGAVTALLLSPLVIPLRRARDRAAAALPRARCLALDPHRSPIGHVVISLPYTILVLLPRLEQIDRVARRGGLRPRGRPADDVPLGDAPADPARRSSRRS